MAETVVVFGTFDGLHEGHRAFFREAKACADRLVVVVARDVTVQLLKGRPVRYSEQTRMEMVRREPAVDEVRLGDAVLGSYAVLKEVHPRVVAVGYDQDTLLEDLTRWKETHMPDIRLVRLSAYKPEQYKSSLL
ncbi:adenylyltransferase/cytidyltransferase family protein [Candidatus Uhrbacteria bacterium]|nr:adenylyltransferase/cytidyltransferase family protein [Candidatus Uhrbacteria bacterium]